MFTVCQLVMIFVKFVEFWAQKVSFSGSLLVVVLRKWRADVPFGKLFLMPFIATAEIQK